MAVTIGSNIEALQAQRNLWGATNALTKVYERLSSGLRINRASDDAAGLAIASDLNANAKIYGQAIRNANDGISAISIAEGAMKELSSLSIRIMELAEQAANGAYSSIQRRANDQEAQKLSAEFTRIVNTTSFNNQQLISAVNGTISLQVGASSQSTSRIDVQFATPVVRGYGDGTLAAPLTLTAAAPNGAGNFEQGDINGDGNIDILFAGSAGVIGFFLANGDGTFKAQNTFTTGYTHGGNEPMALTDMNRDGNLDVVTSTTDAVIVTLGNGDGTFKTGVSYAVSGDPNGVLAEDFNGDGAADIAVMAPDLSGNLQVLINNGNGALGAAVPYAAAGGGRSIAAGDVNGDGKIDICSTNNNQVYLGNGNGTFKLGATFDSAGLIRDLSLVDLNDDGNLDFLVGDSSTWVAVALGNGNGSFAAAATYQTGDQGFDLCQVTYEDFNSDSYMDIATADAESGTISILLNNGNGTFKARTSYTAIADAHHIVAGDFNGDGVADLVTGDYDSPTVNVYFTNATLGGGLPVFSLKTMSGSRTALTKMRTAVQNVALGLGKLGAYQSRVDTAVSNLSVLRENILASASQITDADVASEAASLARLRILQQAGASILSQANQGPALALLLLA